MRLAVRCVMAVLGLWMMACVVAAKSVQRTKEFLSPVYTVDQHYHSSEGPEGGRRIVLLETDEPELLWLQGGRIELVEPDGITPISNEFLCHSFLRMPDRIKRARLYDRKVGVIDKLAKFSSRLIAFIHGTTESRFPEGFGVPVSSAEPLELTEMLLNHSSEEAFDMRFKWTFNFVRDKDLEKPMVPLFTRAVGRGYPMWVVGPGRDVRRFNVTEQLNLPYDTTIHHVIGHLHPYGTNLELWDLTTGRSIFILRATNFQDRVGIERIETLTSEEGILLYKDHDYELVSNYHNTGSEDKDAMASVRIYLKHNTFDPKEIATIVQ